MSNSEIYVSEVSLPKLKQDFSPKIGKPNKKAKVYQSISKLEI